MRNDKVIELDLHGRPLNAADAEALRAVLDRSLALLREALASADPQDRKEPCERIDEFRASLGAAAEPRRQQALAARCFESCRGAVGRLGEAQAERRKEIASLVELVREAMATIAGDAGELQSSLGQSTQRFEALAELNDLNQIKTRLATEVVVLKQIAAERQRVWDDTLASLGKRVATLEYQLLTSRREAAVDGLTQAANRRVFDQACREWIAGKRPFVVALVDIDDFKGINDAYGHPVGDRVLVAVARALKSSVRSGDLVARFGGDEFALLTADLTLPQAEARLRGVLQTLASAPVIVEGATPLGVGISGGVAEFSAGDTAESLVQRADEALYDAKRRGKNRVAARPTPFLRDLLKRA